MNPSAKGAEPVEAQPEDQPQQEALPDVPILYLGSGTFSVEGGVTGRTYIFRGHGAVLVIDAADADGLLHLERRRQRCCGRGQQVLRLFAPA